MGQRISLKYGDRGTWELDYYLEFFCRKFVEITGELDEEKNMVKVTTVKEIWVKHVPKKWIIFNQTFHRSSFK